jgi:Ala-tRNA(Pro) deacylase
MIGQEIVYETLAALGIPFDYLEHPEAPTIEIARRYWSALDSTHCKNLFFRNHKGDRHYLVVFDCERDLDIHDLERRLRQGKLSFASPARVERYLGARAGSLGPFGLLNDAAHHVYLFLDKNLLHARKLSFHPNDNRASLAIPLEGFTRYLAHVGNGHEWIELYR